MEEHAALTVAGAAQALAYRRTCFPFHPSRDGHLKRDDSMTSLSE